MSELFGGVFSRGPVAGLFRDEAWLAAFLEVEEALARVQARAGTITDDDARAVVAACSRLRAGDLELDAGEAGNPVVPLARELRRAAPAAHHGATSQDILDTAMMLLAHRALGAIVTDLSAAGESCARLARDHRNAIMAGRTLLRQAVPITFGLKAAGWLTAIGAVRERLTYLRGHRLAVQYGGPAGTRDLPVGLAAELGLAVPVLPWHSDRTRIGELAGALASTAGALGKIGTDVKLLAQTEVAEVTGAGAGGSSSMPHKANPVRAIAVCACARRAPGPAATLLAAMAGEHERAAGAWHAEWEPIGELFRVTGSAATWTRELLRELGPDETRMTTNLSESLREGSTEAAGAMIDRALAGWEAAR